VLGPALLLLRIGAGAAERRGEAELGHLEGEIGELGRVVARRGSFGSRGGGAIGEEDVPDAEEREIKRLSAEDCGGSELGSRRGVVVSDRLHGSCFCFLLLFFFFFDFFFTSSLFLSLFFMELRS
jgi:hypothetical protein